MLTTAEEWQKISGDMEQDRETAAHFLLHFEHEMEAYRRAKEEQSGGRPDSAGGKGNGPGKPTETAAIKRAVFDETYPPYLWLKAVEIVQRGLSERKKVFLAIRKEAERGRYCERGQKMWVVYVQQRLMEWMGKQSPNTITYVSDSTVRKWWYEIVQRTVEVHIRLKIKR